MSGLYSTRYNLDTVGREPDDETLLNFYKLNDLETDTWPDTLNPLVSPSVFSPPLPKKDEGFIDPLGIYSNINEANNDDSDNASMISFSDSSLNFSSPEFNPKKYLATVHRTTPYKDLVGGLTKLQNEMGEKTESLRSLVKSNFDAFAGAKNTVDELHEEMKSNNITPATNYGTQAYLKTLEDAFKQADTVFGPIMERTNRSEKIRTTMNIVERYKFFFNLPSSMLEYAKTTFYDLAVRDYKKGRHLIKSAASGSEAAGPLQRLFEKVWVAVQDSVSKVHESILAKLDNPWAEMDVQAKHINYLLQLDSSKDPLVYYLENQHKWTIEFIDRSFTEYLETVEAHTQASPNKLNLKANAAPTKDEQAELQRRALVLNALLKAHDSDNFGILLEKIPCSFRWRSSLALIRILGEVVGKTIPELFKFLEQFQSNELYTKLFEKEKADAIWSQMTEEIVALIAITLSKLFHSEAMPLPNRSDKTRHFEIISSLNKKELPPLPVNINCYIVGHYSRLMIQELSSGILESTSVTLSKHARKLILGVFSTFRSDIVSLFCESWVLDTRGLFLIETNSVSQRAKLPTIFYEHQLKCISVIQNIIQTTAPVFADIRPESDPVILESAIPSLIQSTQSFLDGVHYLAFAKAELGPEILNEHLISALSCLISTKEYVRKLLGQFETKLGLSKKLNLLEIKTSEKVLDGLFFDTFIMSRFTPIAQTIGRGILYSGFDWETDLKPKEIRPYVYDILMALVVVHAETLKMADHLIKRVMTKLVELIVSECLTCFRKIDKFSKSGALQATLEMEFIEQTLQPFSNTKILENFKIIYGAIQQGQYSQGQPPFQDIQEQELQILEKLISNARQTTRTQFACFTLNS